jgi:hypothetical protein
MANLPGVDTSAEELAAYLSDYLDGISVYGWVISVTRGDESATQGPTGAAEPSLGDTDSPGTDDPFVLKIVPNE